MTASTRRFHIVFLGVLFVSMSVLSLEVIFTRIFSFSIWYHFAYMTINMALLGFGSSGAVLAAFPQLVQKGGHRLLVVCSLIAGVLIVAALLMVANYPLQPSSIFKHPVQFILSMLGYYVAIALPFFFAGMAISAAVTIYSGSISYLYFWDLIGAGVGSLASLLLINWLEAPGAVLVCALLLLVAAAIFSSSLSRYITFGLSVLAAGWLVCIPLLKDRIEVIPSDDYTLAKLYTDPDSYISLHSEWNAINRVDVYRTVDLAEMPPSFSSDGISEGYNGPLPYCYDILCDAHSGTNICQFTGSLKEYDFLNHHILKTPYLLLQKPKVLVIGPGGGIDVVNAVNNEASSITGVELQPIIVRLLKGPFADWVGRLYNDYPHIQLIASEGRNFLQRDKNKYDLIQLTSTDTWSALTTGAYVLMENYLYTEEAVAEYYDHLTDNGILCLIVWDHIIEGNEPLQPVNSRLMFEYLNVLKLKGLATPEKHIAVLGKPETYANVFTCPLLKKKPFTQAEMAVLREFAERMNFSILVDPYNENIDTNLSRIVSATGEERRRMIDQSIYNISPTTDNTPFFFSFNKWSNIFNRKPLKWWTPVYGQLVLVVMLVQSIVLALAAIILPLAVSKKTRYTASKLWPHLVYFGCLGVGFMFIEISFIQKFVLLLGYPAYAFALTIFALLACTGMGSYWTARITTQLGNVLKRIFILLAITVVLYSVLLPIMFERFVGTSFAVRVVVTILAQMPLGFLLGAFFPLGIKLVRRIDARLVPWAWAVNGTGSVVGTVVAIMLAMSFGFNMVSYISVIFYLVGTVAILQAARASGTAGFVEPAVGI